MLDQIYISGALTNNNRRDFYEAIGDVVKKAGYNPYVPHLNSDAEKNPDVTAKEIYDEDMRAIDNSCMVIAYVGYPSLGVGAELEHANNRGIPIIIISKIGERVSDFALGIPMVKEWFKYHSEDEALEWVYDYLKDLPTSGQLSFFD